MSTFIGGPLDHRRIDLSREPSRVVITNGHTYERIDDPDTGESLGAYVYIGECA